MVKVDEKHRKRNILYLYHLDYTKHTDISNSGQLNKSCWEIENSLKIRKVKIFNNKFAKKKKIISNAVIVIYQM